MDALRVLIVDDNPTFQAVAERELVRDPRVQVVGNAVTGADALVEVARVQPDLVLMDISMPVMNGFEATRRIKACPNPPRVVILTLHNRPDYHDAALRIGADGFLTKAEFEQRLPAMLGRLFPSMEPISVGGLRRGD